MGGMPSVSHSCAGPSPPFVQVGKMRLREVKYLPNIVTSVSEPLLEEHRLVSGHPGHYGWLDCWCAQHSLSLSKASAVSWETPRSREAGQGGLRTESSAHSLSSPQCIFCFCSLQQHTINFTCFLGTGRGASGAGEQELGRGVGRG